MGSPSIFDQLLLQITEGCQVMTGLQKSPLPTCKMLSLSKPLLAFKADSAVLPAERNADFWYQVWSQPARLLLEAGAGIQCTVNASRHLHSIIQHLLEVPGLGSGLQLAYANGSL